MDLERVRLRVEHLHDRQNSKLSPPPPSPPSENLEPTKPTFLSEKKLAGRNDAVPICHKYTRAELSAV